MLPPEVTTAVQQIVVAVSTGAYEEALARTSASRCSASDIARTITDYGRRFSAPPLAEWDIVTIPSGVGAGRWSIRAPLWCDEEGGRSDLELFLSASLAAGSVSVEFDDIRVA